MTTHATTGAGTLAIYRETTAGTPPADWDADGQLVDFTAMDAAGFSQTVITDGVIGDRIFAMGGRASILGMRSVGQFSSSHYLTGHGQTPASGSAPTVTFLSDLLQLALGGRRLVTARAVTGGTATAPTVDAVTGLDVGDFMAFEDLTSPSAANSGKCYVRRIVDIDTLTLTLDESLPFTPADGDAARGTIVIYIDTATIQSTGGISGATASLKVQRGDVAAAASQVWEATACVPTLEIDSIERDGVPTIGLTWGVGAWKTYADGITKTTWSAAKTALASAIVPPRAIGIGSTVWLQAYGTATSVCRSAASVSIGVGVPRPQIETVTECTSGLHGIAGYTTEQADTTIELVLGNLTAVDYEALLQAGTYQVFRYAHTGAYGRGWAIHCPRVTISATPSASEAGPNLATTLSLRATEDLDNADADPVNLWKSKIAIVLA